MLKANYAWKFPLSKYDNELDKRQEGVQFMLDDLRKNRDEEKINKKKQQKSMVQKPPTNTLAFAGAHVMGFGNGMGATNNRESMYSNEKTAYGNYQSHSSDMHPQPVDTRSVRVQRLLEKTKKMIDYQNYISTTNVSKHGTNKKGSHAPSPYGTTMYN